MQMIWLKLMGSDGDEAWAAFNPASIEFVVRRVDFENRLEKKEEYTEQPPDAAITFIFTSTEGRLESGECIEELVKKINEGMTAVEPYPLPEFIADSEKHLCKGDYLLAGVLGETI